MCFDDALSRARLLEQQEADKVEADAHKDDAKEEEDLVDEMYPDNDTFNRRRRRWKVAKAQEALHGEQFSSQVRG